MIGRQITGSVSPPTPRPVPALDRTVIAVFCARIGAFVPQRAWISYQWTHGVELDVQLLVSAAVPLALLGSRNHALTVQDDGMIGGRTWASARWDHSAPIASAKTTDVVLLIGQVSGESSTLQRS